MRRHLGLYVLAFLSLGAVVASLGMSYRAGCAGDVKGGALGDVHLALVLDNWAGVFSIVALLFFGVLLERSLSIRWPIRRIVTLLAVIAGFLAIGRLGLEATVAGIRDCLH